MLRATSRARRRALERSTRWRPIPSRASAPRWARPTRISTGTCPPARAATPISPATSIIKLGTGIKPPTNPRDGTEVCPGLGFRDTDCFVQNLDDRRAGDLRDLRRGRGAQLLGADAGHADAATRATTRSPGCRRRCRIKRVGATYHDDAGCRRRIATSASSASRSTTTARRRGRRKARPSSRGACCTPRSRSRPGQVVYVNLFALDLSGNFSRVTRLIVMPDKLVDRRASTRRSRRRRPKRARARRRRPRSTIADLAQRGLVDDPDDLAVGRLDHRARQPLAGRGCAPALRACARRARGSARAASGRARAA